MGGSEDLTQLFSKQRLEKFLLADMLMMGIRQWTISFLEGSWINSKYMGKHQRYIDNSKQSERRKCRGKEMPGETYGILLSCLINMRVGNDV